HKLEKAEARLDWTQPAEVLARKVRAFHPWPVAEAEVAGDLVRIHAAVALPLAHDAAPGALLHAGRDGIDIACGAGALRIRTLQRAGGKAIAAGDYVNARRELRSGPRPGAGGRCRRASRCGCAPRACSTRSCTAGVR